MRVEFTPSPELFPFQSRWHESGGDRVHYVDEGSGPAILMCHGNPTWSFLYRGVISRLRERGHLVEITARDYAQTLGLLRLQGLEAEDGIDVADDGAGFILGKFAVGSFELLNGSPGLNARVAIFLVAEGFASNARKNGEETRVGFGFVFDGDREIDGVELFEELVQAHGGGFEGDLLEF